MGMKAEKIPLAFFFSPFETLFRLSGTFADLEVSGTRSQPSLAVQGPTIPAAAPATDVIVQVMESGR